MAAVRSRACVTALLFAAAGCSAADSNAHDAGAASHASRDAGRDAALSDASRHVKLRTVAFALPPVATREVSRGSDGDPVYGEIKPLDGASVCVAQRREAFAAMQPFEPVDPPICAKSVAAQPLQLEGVPANSDLVITVEYEGLRPLAVTGQTGDNDVEVHWLSGYSLMLFKQGAFDAWLESPPPAAQDHGVVLTAAADFWVGGGHARPELVKSTDLYAGNAGVAAAYMPDLHETIEPAGGGAAIETKTLSRWRALSLPAGNTIFKFTIANQHLKNCGDLEYDGLPAATDGSLELPVLAGHDHVAAVECLCSGDSATDELLDLGTCSFASRAAADADAGAP
jgi:hypothetical protein